VLNYIEEAIANQKKGLELKPSPKTEIIIPELLRESLLANTGLNEQFKALSPYKQRDYCEYIEGAKQQKTKESRLEKIIPMISRGLGLNDKYK
ncbi:MAG: YdeI/OmpD-associated family protein, partial [Eudoraea sp.]